MYKTPQYQNKVNEQTVQVFDSWSPEQDKRHFVVVWRICPETFGTIQKEHVYPTFEDAMKRVPVIENWLKSHKV